MEDGIRRQETGDRKRRVKSCRAGQDFQSLGDFGSLKPHTDRTSYTISGMIWQRRFHNSCHSFEGKVSIMPIILISTCPSHHHLLSPTTCHPGLSCRDLLTCADHEARKGLSIEGETEMRLSFALRRYRYSAHAPTGMTAIFFVIAPLPLFHLSSPPKLSQPTTCHPGLSCRDLLTCADHEARKRLRDRMQKGNEVFL